MSLIIPRKPHHCRLCNEIINVGEKCESWTNLYPKKGYVTSHAHPECYGITTADDWKDYDWEATYPGDIERPTEALPKPTEL